MLDSNGRFVKHFAKLHAIRATASAPLDWGMISVKHNRRKNLEQLVAQLGGQAAVARELGKDKNQVYQWLQEEGASGHRGIGDSTARLIESTFRLPLGSMDHPGPVSLPQGVRSPVAAYSVKTDLDEPEPGDIQVDVIDIELSAGNGTEGVQFVETKYRHTYRAEYLRRIRVDPKNIRRCRVRGRSMEPILYDGDVVSFDCSNTRIVDEGVYAIVSRDQLKVKMLRRRIDGGLTILSRNAAEFPPEEIAPTDVEHVKILGRVFDKSGSGGLGF